ncbi:MAG: DUF1304 domain-containing protein [Granulosicoccus sp.]
MSHLISLIVGVIALLHLYIAWFEMFAWTTKGPEVFSSFPSELFEPTVSMAANQGLYNGFLAAGLIWSLFIRDSVWKYRVALCFLLFVAVAGIFGAFTVSQRILFVQTLPSALGIALIMFYRKTRASEH